MQTLVLVATAAAAAAAPPARVLLRMPLRRARCALLGRSEKNLDNVLQSTTIYTNVSKARPRFAAKAARCRQAAACGLDARACAVQGVLANKEDLQKVFGMTDEEKICVLARARTHTQPTAAVTRRL